MLAVILEFDVIEGKEQAFVEAWTVCTEVIHRHFGSLGARLHRADNGRFIAYAQWPDQATLEAAGQWPDELVAYQQAMRALLKQGRPRVLHRLDLAVDRLAPLPSTPITPVPEKRCQLR